MSQEAIDMLMGSGAPTCKFPTKGTSYKGRILSIEKTEQTDFATGKVKTFDDGKPRTQLVFTLQTELRDPAIQGDDGKRRLFVKGQGIKAVKTAIVESGFTGKDPTGGVLAIQYWKDGEKAVGKNAQKLFRAKFEAPPADWESASDDETGGDDAEDFGDEPPPASNSGSDADIPF